MHLLYVDESGTVADPKQIFFVLAGVCIYETQGYWISKELDKIAEKFNPDDPQSVELHGSPMYHGKRFWRQFPRQQRMEAIKEALSVFANSHVNNRMFACIVRKSVLTSKDPVEFAFEQLSSRFDYYLRRLKNGGSNQRGIIIFDKSTYENAIQGLAASFRSIGHSWDIIKTLAEVPMFIDSRASRLIQLADLIAYSLFKHYEERDGQFYQIISRRWDTNNGQMHGLYERI